jgi:hypothetical protein
MNKKDVALQVTIAVFTTLLSAWLYYKLSKK